MSTPKIYAERLREIRRAQGLTLKQVEIRSRGLWKGVVVGSYERGTRTLSLEKAILLCEFYGVPAQALFGDNDNQVNQNPRISVDIRRVHQFASTKDSFSLSLKRLIDSILLARGDWNGEVISLRESDWIALTLILGVTRSSIQTSLENRNLIFGTRH